MIRLYSDRKEVSRQTAAQAAKCNGYSVLAVASGGFAQLVDPHVALFDALSTQLERAATVGRRGTLLRVLLKNALVQLEHVRLFTGCGRNDVETFASIARGLNPAPALEIKQDPVVRSDADAQGLNAATYPLMWSSLMILPRS
jgi:hypothetical protein